MLAGAALAAMVALVSRALWLGSPAVTVFDEIFYANDAVDLLQQGVEGGSPVHPPLGKWMVAAGIQVVGFTPVGWRVAPLLAGAAVVFCTFVLAWRVTGRRRAGVIAATIVIVDGVSVVTGRLALLDGLVALWTTVAVLLLVAIADEPLDVGAQRRRRLLLGVVLGLALATKWTAAVLVPLAVVTMVAVDQFLPRQGRWRRSLRSVLVVGLLAAGTYAVVHVPWLVNYEASAAVDDSCREGPCEVGFAGRVGDIVAYQGEVWDYHRTLEPQQPDAASAVHWFGQTHAVRLFVKTCDAELTRHADESDGVCRGSSVREVRVLSMGNPLVWVIGPAALVAAAVVGWRRRDGAVLVLVGAAVMFWLPWLIGGRPGFTFYAAPLVPVLGVLVAVVVEWLPARVARWWPALLGAVVLVSVLLWPLWVGIPLSPEAADRLLWFSGWR